MSIFSLQTLEKIKKYFQERRKRIMKNNNERILERFKQIGNFSGTQNLRGCHFDLTINSDQQKLPEMFLSHVFQLKSDDCLSCIISIEKDVRTNIVTIYYLNIHTDSIHFNIRSMSDDRLYQEIAYFLVQDQEKGLIFLEKQKEE